MMPPATAGPPSVTLFAPKEAVAGVCRPDTFPVVNACSVGLVFRCRADWPNCGHSLGCGAAPAAPAGAAAATRASAAAPAHALILDLNRIGPPSAGPPSQDPAAFSRRLREPAPADRALGIRQWRGRPPPRVDGA